MNPSGKSPSRTAGAEHGLAKAPNFVAARWRKATAEIDLDRAFKENNTAAIMNAAEALVNAAQCGTCVFCEAGHCHANPPTIDSNGDAIFPTVSLDSWCGHYSAPWGNP